jgi:hypothetical protein
MLPHAERRTLLTSDYASRQTTHARTGAPAAQGDRTNVAKSKVRKKAVYTPPQKSTGPQVSPRWLVPTMCVLWLVGLAWIATFYVTASTGTNVPFMSDLGNWNLGIGFTAIIAGVIMSTKWR